MNCDTIKKKNVMRRDGREERCGIKGRELWLMAADKVEEVWEMEVEI